MSSCCCATCWLIMILAEIFGCFERLFGLPDGGYSLLFLLYFCFNFFCIIIKKTFFVFCFFF